MMPKAAARIALSMLVVAGAGCAVRMRATPAETAPATVPRAAPQSAPRRPAVAERAVARTGSEGVPAPPVPARTSSTATSSTAPATIFAPGQTITARPSPATAAGPPPESTTSAPPDAAPRERRDGTSARSPGEVRLAVVASVPVIAAGAIVAVDVMASSSSAVVDAPIHLTFDPSILEFIDGAPGDFLAQGGSSVVFLADGSSRPGDVAVAAGRVEREHGASGAGLLSRVRLRGVGAGTTPILVGDAKVWGTRGEPLTVLAGGTSVVVR